MVGDDLREPTQRFTTDHAAGHLGLLMFVAQGQQRPKTRAAQEVQVTEIKDQRGLQPKKAAHRLDYQVGVGRVNVAVDAHDGG